jgi:subtilisin family serine protease
MKGVFWAIIPVVIAILFGSNAAAQIVEPVIVILDEQPSIRGFLEVQRIEPSRVIVYKIIPAIAIEASAEEQARWKEDDRVVEIVDDILYSTQGRMQSRRAVTTQEFKANWGLKMINVGHRKVDHLDGSGVKVGMVDTGIDYTHPDLEHAYKGGIDFVNGDDDPMDDNGHGTHVSGIIVGKENGEGIRGVVPRADLYVAKVCDRFGRCRLRWLLSGLEWTIEKDVNVINISLGAIFDNSALNLAIERTVSFGIVVVTAAGNRTPDTCLDFNVVYPGGHRLTMAVGALNKKKRVTPWSSVPVDLVAPGDEILSTFLDGEYAVFSGTSMAAPHVVGVVAMHFELANTNDRARVKDVNFNFKIGEEIFSKVLLTTQAGSRNTCTKASRGFGIVDAVGAGTHPFRFPIGRIR